MEVESPASSLPEALKHLAEHPHGDQAVQQFLQTWPLPAVFRVLTAPHTPSAVVVDGCTALRKVFESTSGSELLPQTLPYAAAALRSGSAPLRWLAAQLAGRVAVESAASCSSGSSGGGSSSTDTQQLSERALHVLLDAVSDDDVGVAQQAERGLRQLAAAPGGLNSLLRPEPQSRLRGLASSADPTLRARALALLVGMASTSAAAATAVRQAGLLQGLVAELRQADDLLSCLAALQLVSAAAQQCDAGMAAALQAEVAPMLAELLTRSEEPLLQCAALQAAALLVGTALQTGSAGMDLEGGAAAPAASGFVAVLPANGAGASAGTASDASPLAVPLLGALKTALDVGSDDSIGVEVEEAALDAISTLTLASEGAELLLAQPSGVVADVAYKALGRPPSPAVRVAALHALAGLAGAERATGGSRAAALLGAEAEAALRSAVYAGAGAAGLGFTPAQAFLSQLETPFLEHRVAAYRALAALLFRDWAATDACSTPALLDFLLDPKSETGHQGSEWRFACVTALAATLRTATAAPAGDAVNGMSPFHSVLSAALPRIDAAARQGPFGSSLAAPAEHLVATLPGL